MQGSYLLITDARGERLAAELTAAGHKWHLVPLLKIIYLPLPVIKSGYDAVLLTSPSACVAAASHAGPAWCVGAGTAAAAAAAGFRVEHAGHASVDLVIDALNRAGRRKILYLRGSEVRTARSDFADAVIVYKTEPVTPFPALCAQLMPGAVPVFRSRQAVAWWNEQNLPTPLSYAVSEAVAERLNCNKVLIPPEPQALVAFITQTMIK